ncbi:MAG: hypothetical protein M3P23_16775 [Actinomycetota bacterium]|nr:hypothetical protein [Actinomycetota bacterium]
MTYHVDPDQLRKLASELQRMEAAVADLGRLAADSRVELGSPLLAAGLDEVAGNWAKSRRRIIAQLDALAIRVDAAAAAYGGVEGDLTAALAGR